jgi:hypothetical protein
MRRAFVIVQQVAISFVLVCVATVSAIVSAFGVDRFYCGEINGSEAAGGGAAMGMFVIFLVGLPTAIACTVSETTRAFVPVPLSVRSGVLIAPTILAAIFIYLTTGSKC